jgi:hypothetical protein
MKNIMKEIKLTQGKVALIDDEDFELVSKYKWHAHNDGHTFYAETKVWNGGVKIKLRMHRLIMNAKEDEVIDHRDRNGLNNQKSNLRSCTHSQNNTNRVGIGKSSFRGVSIKIRKHKSKNGTIKEYSYWLASIQINGKSKSLGYFKTEVEAALRYNEEAIKVHGEFAYLNQVNNGCDVIVAEFDTDVKATIVSNF